MSGPPHEKEVLANYARDPNPAGTKRVLTELNVDKLDVFALDMDIEREAKEIKPFGQVSELRCKRSQLRLRLLQDDLEEWDFEDPSAEVERFETEARTYVLEASIFKQQAARVEESAGKKEKNRTGYFMMLWTTSKSGLGFLGTETGRGNWSREDREKFRDQLIKACDSRNPNPIADDMWCPVLCTWVQAKQMHAAHIFPRSAGQEAMDEIFDREEEKVEELSDIMNGLMLSEYAEEKIELGHIVIVPDVADAASKEQIDAWSVSEPKAYKIRVTNSAAEGMSRKCPFNSGITWNQIDGRKMEFRSDHRPHVKYLYWQYCKTMLRMALSNEFTRVQTVQMQERGKPFWRARGPYMKKPMLLAFVEQLGHDHETLMMQNAIIESEEDNNAESDPTALLLACAEIRNENRKHSQFYEEEDGEGGVSDDANQSSECFACGRLG